MPFKIVCGTKSSKLKEEIKNNKRRTFHTVIPISAKHASYCCGFPCIYEILSLVEKHKIYLDPQLKQFNFKPSFEAAPGIN